MKRTRVRKTLEVLAVAAIPATMLWACSNPPPYGGGGRDLGPQMAPMGTSDSGPVDTGVDTGKADTGVVDAGFDTGGG